MRHDEREVQIDLAARNAKSSCFAAFLSGKWCLATNLSAWAAQVPAQLLTHTLVQLLAGCSLGTLPVTAGQRWLLFYDLVWAGGADPPRLPPGE